VRRIVLAFTATLLVVLGGAAPAYAGGANLQPVQDRYEAGDTATFVGYVTPSSVGGWVQDGPYYAYVDLDAYDKVPLGLLTLEPSSLGPRVLRVSLSFTTPEVGPGRYELSFCNDPCARGLGDLAGGALNLGVDPVQPIMREWPADEPEIANLPAGAVVSVLTAGPAAAKPASEASAPSSPSPPTPATVSTTPARPLTTSGPDASPTALAIGGVLAAICTGMVLFALREG
jgi:hypothetical protein